LGDEGWEGGGRLVQGKGLGMLFCYHTVLDWRNNKALKKSSMFTIPEDEWIVSRMIIY